MTMLIQVISQEKEGSKEINVRFPLSVALAKMISKHQDEMPPEQLKQLFRDLKKYIKENGHFVFLEVSSADGDYVRIIV